MDRVPLTQLAHDRVRPFLADGAEAIDATAGNGRDTVFLAEGVGEKGRVYAFDIQDDAIAATRGRLQDAGLAERVTLLHASHAHLHRHLPPEAHGRISAGMFNLGYLPGGDHAIVTRAETTVAALEAVVPLLAPRACISIVAYRGHPGGAEEYRAIQHWSRGDTAALFEVQELPSQDPRGPVHFLFEWGDG